jgi:hypothetical protein
MSLFEVMGWRILRAEVRVSAAMALERSSTRSTAAFQAGFQSSMALGPAQLAKASFSQMSSHQAVVTRSPNHWWATSWA